MALTASASIPRVIARHVSEDAKRRLDEIELFVQERCIPADAVFAQQLGHSAKERFNAHPQILEDLKLEARKKGLWNLFLAKNHYKEGAGFTNVEYGLMAEQLGKSQIASEVMNCSAPDTGNMEVLAKFGSDEQRTTWLGRLLDGKIRSAFLMTEPNIASSDATNIQFEIKRDKDEYVLNGSKWWSSGAGDPRCELYIVMGKTSPNDPNVHQQQSVILVPARTRGITVRRMLSVFGYDDAPHGHGHITFENVRVPMANMVLGEGRGFEIIQGRLGPGRIHHAMRCIGAAERALDLMLARMHEPTKRAFGKLLHEHGVVLEQVARARVEIDAGRLLVLNAALKIDTGDAKQALTEIAEAKVFVPAMLGRVLDDAIQLHGGEGVCQDTPLAYMWASARTMRLVDGPDAVHLLQLGRKESRRATDVRGRLQKQGEVEAELFKQYEVQKVDSLDMGWKGTARARL